MSGGELERIDGPQRIPCDGKIRVCQGEDGVLRYLWSDGWWRLESEELAAERTRVAELEEKLRVAREALDKIAKGSIFEPGAYIPCDDPKELQRGIYAARNAAMGIATQAIAHLERKEAPK
jgi:hypothetical protein